MLTRKLVWAGLNDAPLNHKSVELVHVELELGGSLPLVGAIVSEVLILLLRNVNLEPLDQRTLEHMPASEELSGPLEGKTLLENSLSLVLGIFQV